MAHRRTVMAELRHYQSGIDDRHRKLGGSQSRIRPADPQSSRVDSDEGRHDRTIHRSDRSSRKPDLGGYSVGHTFVERGDRQRFPTCDVHFNHVAAEGNVVLNDRADELQFGHLTQLFLCYSRFSIRDGRSLSGAIRSTDSIIGNVRDVVGLLFPRPQPKAATGVSSPELRPTTHVRRTGNSSRINEANPALVSRSTSHIVRGSLRSVVFIRPLLRYRSKQGRGRAAQDAVCTSHGPAFWICR